MVTSESAQHVIAWQKSLLKKGARSIVEARLLHPKGAFVSPGLIDVTSLVDRDFAEVLGPLITVTRVDAFDDAIAEANGTSFGLAAGVVTADVELYKRFADNVLAGVVSWNSPLTGNSAWAAFGGAKASGNYRPTGFLSADYCVRAVGSTEAPTPRVPAKLPPGLSLCSDGSS
jgi:succinylglutamic semialdehyde dehydrogenase